MNDRSLEDIQDEVLDRLHAGEPIDRAALLAQHPAHADSLRQFFGLLDAIEATPSKGAAGPSQLGEFEILREIGRGGMGIVYEARQISLKRRVALKVLPPALRQDGRLLARFRREAEAAARLRHPNIVPVYSVGESAGAPFFAMELVEGRSLRDLILERREGRLAGLPVASDDYRRWAVETLARVADALDYVHGCGILHRDIKPGNILLEQDGTPRLTDFGLALDLQASELTLSGEVFGSPMYMSPEQAFRREQPVDSRTDIYSLAVTLCELLTLHLPYAGSSQGDVLAALAEGRIVSPRSVDPGMPEPLERVLLHALRKDPRERYQTAAEFAADLRAALQGRAVAAAAAVAGAAAVATPEPERADGMAEHRPARWLRVVRAVPAAFLWASVVLLLWRLIASRGSIGGFEILLVLVLTTAAAACTWWAAAGSSRQRYATRASFRERHPIAGHPAVAIGCGLLALLLFLGILSLLLFGGTARPRTSASGGTASADSAAPDASQLAALADGKLPDGEQFLAAWIRPVFRCRSVISRQEPGNCAFIWTNSWPDSAPAGVRLSCWTETSVDDGPWMGLGPFTVTSPPMGPAIGRLSWDTFPLGLADVLGRAMDRDRVTIRPRFVARIARVPVDGHEPLAGTAFTWVGEPETVFIHDTYPADYPRAMTDPGIEIRMRGLVSTASAILVPEAGPPSEGMVQVMLTFPAPLNSPVPGAFDVDLLQPGSDAALATTTIAWPAGDDARPAGPRAWALRFKRDAQVPEDRWRSLFDDLLSGKVEHLQLSFRPSRAVALQEPDFDEYWNGTFTVDVPGRLAAR